MTATTRPGVDHRSPLAVDVHELGRRPGAMTRLARTVPAPAELGSDVIGIDEGSDLDLEVTLESVVDGVYVSGTATAQASGECSRCLDPVDQRVRATVQELYLYAPPDDPAEDLDEVLLVQGEWVDLAAAVRDAVVTALPFQPVCSQDCPGLCGRCGARLADHPGHEHEDVDPRWAALRALAPEAADPPGDPSGHPGPADAPR